MPQSTTPLVRFHTLIDGARPPQRADRSAAGTLPTRAFRYCDAAASASAFGWWVFPPTDVMLRWDGADIFWKFEGACDWLPLLPAAQFPNFVSQFNRCTPQNVAGYSPPFLTALPDAGLLQIWTGIIARTAPGWSLLLRAPANLPSPGGYCLYEGIVETDRWFGPLFTNLRMTRTQAPVRLRADFPLLQVQPIPDRSRSDEVLSSISIEPGLAGLAQHDWDDYFATVVAPNCNQNRDFGRYAANARKRREHACPSTEPTGCVRNTRNE